MKKAQQSQLLYAAIVVGMVLIALVIALIFKNNGSQAPGTSGTHHVINDKEKGVSLKASKKFEQVDSQKLQAQSSMLLYGFKPPDVDSVACLVSQTIRPSSENVPPDYLIQGTLKELRKTNPDATLDSSKGVELAEGIVGALMILSYKEAEASTKRIELVATTDKRTTFAYCYCPASLYEHYLPTFEELIYSIEISRTET